MLKDGVRIVEIARVQGETELFRHYPEQSAPQPCYLGLDLETGRLFCDYNPQVGPPYAVSMAEYLGRVRTVDIPCLSGDAANELMGRVRSLAQEVLDDAEIDWNGNNNVGLLGEAASDAWGQICDVVADLDPDPRELVTGWEAGDAYEGYALADELGISADTTDEDIAGLVPRVEQEMRASLEGVVVPLRVEKFLLGLRNEAREFAGV